mmetsp:Transcript_28433/g.47742  ORF Transcript_28433/g.47742 Transcript_28433/m.47742 type:complete len:159 (+) Transcript_28433:113-589(+)|eukprot:CAMPEP_0198200052 /NCGR_PEP_ID=MMETSP1445-20131203/3124_1 /TAXON_ID=36898 /ORGANISM="Pyramimonas sp., Strain CCMP2087" /LENGTH=158 /DNA_ID=CAMNT_0043869997 /DNA_START=107 /DNA_END=583 /DNA_ORIENTATION=-
MKDDISAGRERRSIVWNEANLEYNEANKSSTMKIDEPKTPWASPTASELDETEYGEDSMESRMLDEDAIEEKLHADRREVAESLSPAVADGGCLSSPIHHHSAEGVDPAGDEDEDDDDAGVKRKGNFKQQRTSHYNEFAMIQRARLLMEEDDEDENGN